MSEQNSRAENQTAGASAAPAVALQAGPPPLPQAYPPPPPPSPAAPPRLTVAGRRYGFLCSYCSSRLEAVESMAGQSGTCPTCGNSIVIPILDYRGRLIDPTSGEIIKQDPHPVHAYAAAGHKAPQIVNVDGSEERFIKCPRCGRGNALASNNCLGCGLPFTMEGTVGDAVAGTNTWAVASLVLGIVGVPAGCLVVPPVLAIVFGLIALRNTNQATGQTPGTGLAVAGLILGAVGIVIGVLIWMNGLHL